MAIDTGLLFKIKADGSQAKAEARETATAVKQAFNKDPFGDMRAHLDDMKRRLALLRSDALNAARGIGTLDDNAKRSSGRGGGVGQFIEALAQGDPGELLGEIAQQGGGAGAAIAAVTLAAGAATLAIGAMTKAVIENVREVDKLARDTKLSTEQIQGLQVVANLTGESVEDLAENYKKIGPEVKRFEELVRSSGAAIDEDLRQKAQQAAVAWEGFKLAATGALYTIGREALPAVTSALRDLRNLILETKPAWEALGGAAASFARTASDNVNDVRRVVALLKGELLSLPSLRTAKKDGLGFSDFFTRSPIGTGLEVAQQVAAGRARRKDQFGTLGGSEDFGDTSDSFTTPSLKGGKGGSRGGGLKRQDISEIELEIRILRTRQEEAQRAMNGTAEAARLLYDITQELIEKEREQAATLLPNERLAKLAELRQKQLEALQKYSEGLSKANDILLQPMEALAKQIKEQNIAAAKAAEEADAYVREQYELEADVYQRRAELQQTIQATFYINRKKAIANLAALEIDAEERRFERIKEAAEREMELMEETDERRKAINDRLLAQEAEKEARITLIRRQSILDQQRAQPNSNLNLFGPAINDALNSVNAINAAVGQQTSIFETVGVAMRAYAQDLATTLPNAAQLAIQSFQSIGAAMSESISAFLVGQATVRQAIGSIITAMLEPYKKWAQTKAAIHFAAAAGDFAFGNVAGGFKHLAAGAGFAALAGLIGAAGSLIGGSGARAITPTSAIPTTATADRGKRIIEQGDRQRAPEPQVIIIRAETEPGVVIRRVIEDYNNNGATRQIVRRDVLGEM